MHSDTLSGGGVVGGKELLEIWQLEKKGKMGILNKKYRKKYPFNFQFWHTVLFLLKYVEVWAKTIKIRIEIQRQETKNRTNSKMEKSF